MNRRSFFKVVTRFTAGVIAIFAPKAKSEPKTLTSSKLAELRRREQTRQARKVSWDIYGDPNKLHCRNNTEFYKEVQFGESFAGKIVSMTTFQGNLWIAAENGVYKIKEKLV